MLGMTNCKSYIYKGSFLAVSKNNFLSKQYTLYSFYKCFRDLQVLRIFVPLQEQQLNEKDNLFANIFTTFG